MQVRSILGKRREFLFFFCLSLLAGLPALYEIMVMPTPKAQTDLYPMIVAARLYQAEKYEGVYANEPFGGYRHPDWVREEQKIPLGSWRTVFPYMPVYMLPFVVLERNFTVLQLALGWAVLNALIMTAFVASIGAGLRAPVLVKGLITCLMAYANITWFPVHFGNNILLCVTSLWFFVGFYIRGRLAPAVLFYVLATLMKPWAVLFGLLPLFRLDWRACFTMGFAYVGVLAAHALWNFDLLMGYFELTLAHAKMGVVHYANYSPSAALERFNMGYWFHYAGGAASPPISARVRAVAYLGVLAVVIVGFRSRRTGTKLWCTIMAIFLAANVFWNHYVALFLPVFAPALLGLRREHPIWFVIISILALFTFLFNPNTQVLDLMNMIRPIVPPDYLERVAAIPGLFAPIALIATFILHIRRRPARLNVT